MLGTIRGSAAALSAAAPDQLWKSSIGEEMGGLGLVPARTMRATAADCSLPLSSQAIRKHLRDRGVGAGVAPEFLAKRNSELVGIRDGAPTTPSVSGLANSGALSISAERPLAKSKQDHGSFRPRAAARIRGEWKAGLSAHRPSRQTGQRRAELRKWRRAGASPAASQDLPSSSREYRGDPGS
jgi:hypothetical protein